MSERETLVSVDLDDVACYHGIHDLPEPDGDLRSVVLRRCLPRFLDLFEELGVAATFFVIGRDAAREQDEDGVGLAELRRAMALGHELGNHSFSHAYDLVTWSREVMLEDLRRCDSVLRELGAAPAGFRAPGYTHNATMLGCVAELGYAYDSSVLPSLPYYAAKVGVIASMAARGRRSRSMVRGVRSFVGGARPRFLAAHGIWELPMSVSPGLRLPLIGTSLLATTEGVSRRLRATAETLDHFHLELHGLDLADPETDGYAPALLARQPELRSPLKLRLERLRGLLSARGGGSSLASAVVARASAARA